MPIQYFEVGQAGTFRATQVWQILAGLARERKTITYRQLSALMGYESGGLTGIYRGLEPVGAFCQRYNLPQLLVLVVASSTGQPGRTTERFVGEEDYYTERERVYEENWHLIVPPTEREFVEAMEHYNVFVASTDEDDDETEC